MVVSGVAHVLLLVSFLVAFSTTKKFEDAQESVPVEVLTEEQFHQITKGERDAPPQEQPAPRVDRQAAVQSEAPKPPVNEAPQETSTPPPQLRRLPEPETAQEAEPQPQQAAPSPPPRPEPEPESEPAPPVPTPPARPPAPAKPAPAKPAQATPEPPPVPVPTPRPAQPQTAKPAPKPEPKPVPTAKPAPKPEPVEKPAPQVAQKPAPVPPRRPNIPQTPAKPKPDQIAALAEKTTNVQPSARPRAASETSPQTSKYDPSAINKLLSREKPSQRAATGTTVNPQAARGAPTASAQKMSPSMWSQLDGLMQEQYKRCWNYAGLSAGQKYIPQISVSYSRDGALQGQPRLMNPPSDPSLKSLADSAMRAVQRCNPLRIPAQFAPYYDQWKGRVLRFDPEEMMG
ncbi:MAG: cell envelope biogenesis protein TolA [Alphaproteobacteria bacterium]|nr:cell envelope biogenesis protein TolA [Alphaproteobacteria bacterium]